MTTNVDHGIHISVIIPYHQEQSSVYESIKSVLLQSYPACELILVSDGCKTDLDLRKLPKAPIKIKTIRLESNLGPAGARNAGMKEAEGNFISFLDSDDFWGPDKLLNQVRILSQQVDKTSIVTVCPVRLIVNKKESHTRFPRLEQSSAGRARLFKAPYLYLGSTALFSSELLQSVGFQNTKLRIYEDFEWQLRMACNNNISFLSSQCTDVFINKSFKHFSRKKLDENYQELCSSISSHPRFPSKYRRYLSSVYFIDISRNYLRKGQYIHFVRFLIASFFICPRLTLYNEKLWDINYKNGISKRR